MIFAVIGAGAVGGYFGARLHEAGHTVRFLARGSHLKEIQNKGLQLKSISGDYHAKNIEAFDKIEKIGPVDVVLVAVKAWQVKEIAEQLLPMAKSETFFVPLQNGVEAHAQLSSILGKDRVLGGLCGLIAFLEKPGLIRHVGADPFLTFGEQNKKFSKRTKDLEKSLSNCRGLTGRLSDDIEKSVWEKFLLISAFSGVGGVTRMPIGIIRSIPETRKMLDDALREVADVANSRGIDLNENILKKTWQFFDTLPPQGTASMQRDLIEGKPSELESQTGVIVRYGKQSKIPTPINSFIYNTLLPSEKKARGDLNLP
mgnify:FL=1